MNSRLSYFLENFWLAYQAEQDATAPTIGYENSCSVQLAKAEIDNPITEFDAITWQEWKGKHLPFLMNSSNHKSVIEKKENGVVINFDIATAGWFLMSGAQELPNHHKDQYGRFQYKESLQKELEITELPLVNYYFDILKEAIEQVTGINIQPKMSFSATLTHDIDEITSAWKHQIRINLEKKQLGKAIKNGLSQMLSPFAPWKNLKEMADFNTANQIKSTFFFLPRNNKLGAIKNADYEFDSQYIQDNLKLLSEKGNELGVHGSYKTHDSTSELKKDIKNFNFPVNGNRFHFLQFDVAKTPQILTESKLSYDTTLGFQEHIGFRNSICTPFYLYDFENDKTSQVIEIPLNVMDCSLEYAHYMNLNPAESLSRIKNLIQEIKKFDGNFCINWHNTYFSEYRKSDWKILYKEIIKLLKEDKAQFLTCSELVDSIKI